MNKICQYERSRSNLFILSKRHDNLIVIQMYGSSFHKFYVITELKNHDDDFVDDRQCTAQARPVNFVVVVSSTMPNKVESRRPATHKLRQV